MHPGTEFQCLGTRTCATHISHASGTRRHQSPVDAADHNPSGIQSKAASQAGGALIALQSGTECAAASLVFFLFRALFPGQDEPHDFGQLSCMHRLYAGRQWEVNSNDRGLLGRMGQVDICTLHTHTICSNATMSGHFAICMHIIRELVCV